jgi:hypothetical protein
MSHGMSFGATSGPPHSPVGSGLMPHRPRTADHEADDRQRATQSFHAALNSVVSLLVNFEMLGKELVCSYEAFLKAPRSKTRSTNSSTVEQ